MIVVSCLHRFYVISNIPYLKIHVSHTFPRHSLLLYSLPLLTIIIILVFLHASTKPYNIYTPYNNYIHILI